MLKKIYVIALTFALHIVLTAFTILILSVLLFSLNILINPFIFPISLLVSTILTLFITKDLRKENKTDRKTIILSITVLLLIYATSIFISTKFYDTSYDGQTYHQEAIIKMVKEEYNPLKGQGDIDTPDVVKVSKWVKHYPKGSEIISANIYAFTKRLESGKAFNILFVISSFLITIYIFNKVFKFDILKNLLLSTAVALNPVSIYQSLSYYVDGEISSLIIIGVFLIVLITTQKKKKYILPFLAIICLLINFKFSGIYFAVVLCISISIFEFFKHKDWKKTLQLASILLATGLLSIAIVGFNPYTLNTINYKHPLYPLMGEKSDDIMTTNTPDEYKELSIPEKNIYSHFGITNIENLKSLKYQRIPFLPAREDLKFVAVVDSRYLGFGIYFLEIMIIASILYIKILLSKDIPKRKKIYFVTTFLILFVSSSFMQESWWARYIPHMYLLGIIPLTITIPSKKHTTLIEVLLFLLLLNSLNISLLYVYREYRRTRSINLAIQTFKNEGREVYIYEHDAFSNNYIRLEENGVKYHLVLTKYEWNSCKGEKLLPFEYSDLKIRYKE